MKKQNIGLLLIDPQNDFCSRNGSLYVPGADVDMDRTSNFLTQLQPDEITVTLDSHASVGIERVTFWRWGNGSDIAPFTPIALTQVRTGEITPRNPAMKEAAINYLAHLERSENYQLVAWPVHCVMGTWGHNIEITLMSAIDQWEIKNQKTASRFFKGMDSMTEQYSAVRPEVDYGVDLSNKALIERLCKNEEQILLVSGEASSHCVPETIRDLWEYMTPEKIARTVLLSDTMSPVSGFLDEQNSFFNEARQKGAMVLTCKEAISIFN